MTGPTGPYDAQEPGQPSQPGQDHYAQQYQQPGYSESGYPQPGTPGHGGQPLPPLAHWGLRLGGYLLDALLIVPAYLVAAIVMGATTGPDGDPSSLGYGVGGFFYLVGVVFVFWNIVFRQGRTGWSIGKQVVGIRLLKEQTMQPLGAGMTFVRQLAHFLDTLPCYLGWLWPLWDAKKQTFADKIIGTVVVVQPKPKG